VGAWLPIPLVARLKRVASTVRGKRRHARRTVTCEPLTKILFFQPLNRPRNLPKSTTELARDLIECHGIPSVSHDDTQHRTRLTTPDYIDDSVTHLAVYVELEISRPEWNPLFLRSAHIETI